VGQWVKIKVTAPLGAAAGTWNLEVTDGSAAKKVLSGLKNVSSGWRGLNWIVLASDSGVASTTCIGSITANNQ